MAAKDASVQKDVPSESTQVFGSESPRSSGLAFQTAGRPTLDIELDRVGQIQIVCRSFGRSQRVG